MVDNPGGTDNYITYDYLRKLETKFNHMDDKVLNTILNSLQSGMAFKADLETARELVVDYEELKKEIDKAVNRIMEFETADILVIRAHRHIYGTGKTQIANFLRQELKNRFNIQTFYTVIDSKNFREKLGKIRDLMNKSEGKTVVAIIDEVDLLVDPSLSDEEQRRIIEEFANELISIAQEADSMDIPLKIILVLSAKVDDLINEVSMSRLGRRLSHTLIEADLKLDEKKVQELAAKFLVAMWVINYEKIQEKVSKSTFFELMKDFSRDLARAIFSTTPESQLSIGVIVTKLLKIFDLIFKHIDNKNFEEMYKKLIGDDRQFIGSKLESYIKEYLKKFIGAIETEIGGDKIVAIYDATPIQIGEHKTDGIYNIMIGDKLIGGIIVEITVTRDVLSKREQLISFTEHYPTLLIYSRSVNDKTPRDDVQAVYNDPSLKYELFPVSFIEEITRYSIILKPEYAPYLIRESSPMEQPIRSLVRKHISAFYEIWKSTTMLETPPFASTSIEVIEKAEETTPSTAESGKINAMQIATAIRTALSGEFKALSLDTKKNIRKTTLINSIKKRINNILRTVGLKIIDDKEWPTIVEDIINSWISNKLGRKTEKTFIPFNAKNSPTNPLWKVETAVELAQKQLIQRIIDRNKDKIDPATIP